MSAAIVDGMSLRKASKSTLHDRVTGKNIFSGKSGPSLYIIYIIGFYSNVWIRRKICLCFVFCCKKSLEKVEEELKDFQVFSYC